MPVQGINRKHARLMAILVTALLLGAAATLTFGSLSSPRFNRHEVKKSETGTHFVFKLSSTPETVLTRLPDRRVRLVLKGVEPGFIRSITRYSDDIVRQVSFGVRMNDVVLTFTLADPETGVRLHREEESGIITLDFGPGYRARGVGGVSPSREAIRVGVERLVREYDPPLESGMPFTPVERTEVYSLLNPGDAALMKEGEALLYKGVAAEAEALFSSITHDDPKIRSLILTRRGESRYLLQKYREALDDFIAAEKVYPDIIDLNPTAFFAFGDCLARTGDPEQGRQRLARLIARNAGKPYAPNLLVRLGDILGRGGREQEAAAIYRNVMTFFPDSPASFQARMKMADKRILSVDSSSYQSLLAEYRDIRERGGDFRLREEAAFKEMVLLALHAEPEEAAARIDEFLKRYPKSPYSGVAESMQYDIVVELLTGMIAGSDHEGVVRAVDTYRDHLAKALQEEPLVRGIAAAFRETSRLRERLEAFRVFQERRWGGSQAPFLVRTVIDDARALGEDEVADASSELFLQRFPSDPMAPAVRETLAEIRFARGRHADVARILSPFHESRKGISPSRADTLYYLGKSLVETGEPAKGAAVLERYLAVRKSITGSPLAAEALHELSRALELSGDLRKAEEVIARREAELPREMRERFVYRRGALLLKRGARERGIRLLREIGEKGTDPVWRTAARQQLIHDEVSAEIREAKRLLSKK